MKLKKWIDNQNIQIAKFCIAFNFLWNSISRFISNIALEKDSGESSDQCSNFTLRDTLLSHKLARTDKPSD